MGLSFSRATFTYVCRGFAANQCHFADEVTPQIPFGGLLVPKILSLLPSKHVKKVSRKDLGQLNYSINSSKLHAQIVAYTLTSQITGAFVEIGVPFLMQMLSQKVAQAKNNGSEDKGADDAEDERSFLDRVRAESALPEYDTFAD